MRYRRLFALADIYFSFVNVVKGLVITVTRFGYFVASFFALLMRPDISAVPFDPAVKAFDGMLLLDVTYNNPIAMVANDILRASLKRIRARHAREAAAAAAAGARSGRTLLPSLSRSRMTTAAAASARSALMSSSARRDTGGPAQRHAYAPQVLDDVGMLLARRLVHSRQTLVVRDAGLGEQRTCM